MRKALTALVVLLALSLGVGAEEQRHATSTPEERARAVRIAQALEAGPTDLSLRDDYKWLLRWAAEEPDLAFLICPANMPWNDKYKHSGDLAAVGLAATVAFVIQHPDEGKDAATAGFAAMESMLRAYQKIVEQDPQARSKEMDDVVEIQRQGKLEEYIRTRWTETCKDLVIPLADSLLCHGDSNDRANCITPPRQIHSPKPKYPKTERKARHEGTVTLKLVVSTDGVPLRITISQTLSPDFDNAAIDALKQWKFSPAMKDGKPVAVAISIKMAFLLHH
jgi:TonB family protein